MLPKGVQSWAARCKDVEKKFRGEFHEPLPWDTTTVFFGYVPMLIYMQLCALEHACMVNISRDLSTSFERKDGKAFFQITRVTVPAHARTFFDTLAMPSRCGCRHWARKDKKQLTERWQKAGFDESTSEDGSLILTFNSKTFYKACKRTPCVAVDSNEASFNELLDEIAKPVDWLSATSFLLSEN